MTGRQKPLVKIQRAQLVKFKRAPTADLKEARRLLAEAPSGDPFKAAEELTHWLESVRTAPGFKPEYLAQLIDDAAQLHVRKLQRDYVSNPRLSKFQEQRLWGAIHEYWNQSALGYVACLDLFSAGAKGADALKGSLPLLVVRALRALAAQIKWQYLRYGPFDNSRWGVVAKVYALAEARKIAAVKVAVHAGVAGESSAEQEFVRVVMLAASSPSSLLPFEIELTERMIAHFSASFTQSLDQQPDIAYWIDLATDRPPLRIARPPQHAPTLRFFAAGKAAQDLEQLINTIAATRNIPAALNLGAGNEPEAVLEVLRHLALCWSSNPPERRHPRHRVKSRLNVSPGLAGVVAALNPAATLDFDDNRMENWIVDDVSAGGFGASIPQIKGEWLKIGCLVALQPEGGDNWVIGVIRRLTRDAPQKGSVGIQTLARAAAVVALKVQDGDASDAVLLNPADEALEAQVLVKSGAFVAGQQYGFEYAGKEVMLMSAALQERGEDYELLRARQMIRDTGE